MLQFKTLRSALIRTLEDIDPRFSAEKEPENIDATQAEIKQISLVLQEYHDRINLQDFIEICSRFEILHPQELFTDLGGNPKSFIVKRKVAVALIVLSQSLQEEKLRELEKFVANTPRGRTEFVELYLKLKYIYVPTCATRDKTLDAHTRSQILACLRYLPNLTILISRNMSQHSDLLSALRSCMEDEKSLEHVQQLNKILGQVHSTSDSNKKHATLKSNQEESHSIHAVEDEEEEKIEFSAPKKRPTALHAAPHPIADVMPGETEQDPGSNEEYKSPLDVDDEIITTDSSDIQEFWALKKQNFVRMKLWDDEKFLELARHRTVLNNIFHRLKNLAKFGRDDNEAKINFLKKASAAEASYGKDLGDLLSFFPM